MDGLRALAALTVLVHHAWLFSVTDGAGPLVLPLHAHHVTSALRFGLTLFFVLSGFLLFRPFAAAALGRARPSIAGYARNRVLRIVPAYWAILLVAGFVLQQAIVGTYPLTLGRPDDASLLVLDLALLQNYSWETVSTGIGPAWSLGVEAVFYVLLVPLGLLAIRLGRRGPWVPVALLLAIGVVTRGLIAADVFHGTFELLLRFSFPANADLFALGMAAAVWRVQVEDGTLQAPRWFAAAALGGAAGLSAVTLLVAPLGAGGVGGLWDPVMGIAATLLLLAVCLPAAGRLTRALEWRPLVLLGLCSYSVYLWHTPVIFLLRDWGVDSSGAASLLVATAGALVVTLALSALTYRYVERPALSRKRRSVASVGAPGWPSDVNPKDWSSVSASSASSGTSSVTSAMARDASR